MKRLCAVLLLVCSSISSAAVDMSVSLTSPTFMSRVSQQENFLIIATYPKISWSLTNSYWKFAPLDGMFAVTNANNGYPIDPSSGMTNFYYVYSIVGPADSFYSTRIMMAISKTNPNLGYGPDAALRYSVAGRADLYHWAWMPPTWSFWTQLTDSDHNDCAYGQWDWNPGTPGLQSPVLPGWPDPGDGGNILLPYPHDDDPAMPIIPSDPDDYDDIQWPTTWPRPTIDADPYMDDGYEFEIGNPVAALDDTSWDDDVVVMQITADFAGGNSAYYVIEFEDEDDEVTNTTQRLPASGCVDGTDELVVEWVADDSAFDPANDELCDVCYRMKISCYDDDDVEVGVQYKEFRFFRPLTRD